MRFIKMFIAWLAALLTLFAGFSFSSCDSQTPKDDTGVVDPSGDGTKPEQKKEETIEYLGATISKILTSKVGYQIDVATEAKYVGADGKEEMSSTSTSVMNFTYDSTKEGINGLILDYVEDSQFKSLSGLAYGYNAIYIRGNEFYEAAEYAGEEPFTQEAKDNMEYIKDISVEALGIAGAFFDKETGKMNEEILETVTEVGVDAAVGAVAKLFTNVVTPLLKAETNGTKLEVSVDLMDAALELANTAKELIEAAPQEDSTVLELLKVEKVQTLLQTYLKDFTAKELQFILQNGLDNFAEQLPPITLPAAEEGELAYAYLLKLANVKIEGQSLGEMVIGKDMLDGLKQEIETFIAQGQEAKKNGEQLLIKLSFENQELVEILMVSKTSSAYYEAAPSMAIQTISIKIQEKAFTPKDVSKLKIEQNYEDIDNSKPDYDDIYDNGSGDKHEPNVGGNNGSGDKHEPNVGGNNGSGDKHEPNAGGNNGSGEKDEIHFGGNNNSGSNSNSGGNPNSGNGEKDDMISGGIGGVEHDEPISGDYDKPYKPNKPSEKGEIYVGDINDKDVIYVGDINDKAA